jgi:CCR4-NOT transcription complex subunit 1
MVPLALEAKPYNFALDMALLAARSRDIVNLERWLPDRLQALGDDFARALLSFVRDRFLSNPQKAEQQSNQKGAMGWLTPELVAMFFKALQANSKTLGPEVSEELKHVYNHCVSVNPNFKTLNADQSNAVFATEIEDEANSYFQKIYTCQQTIDEVIQMLKGFKTSKNRREQEVFACMIHNLFDEYRFFPRYPEKELRITGVLFGSLIQHALVSSTTLGIALRYVLEALRKQLHTNMFKFGITAIEQFKARLPEWPQYCSHIQQIPQIRQMHPELIAYIDKALNPTVSPQQLHDQSQASDPMQQQAQSSGQQQLQGIPGKPPSGVMPAGQASGFGQQTYDLNPGVHQGAMGMHGAEGNFPPMYPQQPGMYPESDSGPQRPPGIPNQQGVQGHVQNMQPVEDRRPHHPMDQGPPGHHGMGGLAGVPQMPAQQGRTQQAHAQPTPASTGSKEPSFATSLNIDTLLYAAHSKVVQMPDQMIQDKVHFIFNNLSTANLEQKVKELHDLVLVDFHPWLAQYIVVKRASIEPNFHMLYLSFLERIKNNKLVKMVQRTSYENIKVLLQSDKITVSSSERSLLKNLGSWLGNLTIGKNAPLLQKDLDLKHLIFDAYENGRLIAVIPFVAKVLEACSKSKIFKPPNPWVMALLGVLCELYPVQDLKLNLKFEIEVLCKHLQVDIKDITATNFLKDHTIKNTTSNPDFTSMHSGDASTTPQVRPANSPSLGPVSDPNTPAMPSGQSSSISPLVSASEPSVLPSDDKLSLPPTGAPGIPPVAPYTAGSQPVAGQTAPAGPGEQTAIPGLAGHITISPSIALFQHNQSLKRCVPVAVDRAIREIISPVVERSVTIACITTRELVLKDFAMEPDESKMRKAAHLMVRNLSGNLSLVTCKELLRVSMYNQLKTLLQQSGVGSGNQEMVEQAIQTVCSDNLDLGCAFIEKNAVEKAIRDIDDALAPAYSVRRQHREQDKPYYDMSIFAVGRYPQSLPEPLRPKPGGLQPLQLQVYEEFSRMQSTPSLNLPLGGATQGITPAGMRGPQQAGMAGVQGQMGLGMGLSSSSSLGPAGSSSSSGPSMSDQPLPLHLVGGQPGEPPRAAQRPVGPPAQMPIGAPMNNAPAEPVEEKLSTQQVLEKVNGCLSVLEMWHQQLPNMQLSNLPDGHEVHQQLRKIPAFLMQSVTRDETALALAQRIFKRLYEPDRGLTIEVLLVVLESIKDVCKKLVKELTSWIIYSDVDRKLNKEITSGFISLGLVNVSEFDPHMAKLMDNGRNQNVLDFNIFLVSYSLVQKQDVTQTEFYNIVDALSKLKSKPEGLPQLLEEVRSLKEVPKEDKLRAKEKGKQKPSAEVKSGKDSTDPVWLREQVSSLFDQWLDAYNMQSDKAYAQCISELQRLGVLKGDDMSDRFFRVVTELTVDKYQSDSNLQAVDAFAKLVVLLVKYADGAQSMTRVNLVSKVLSVVTRSLVREYESKKFKFDQRPFYRLFVQWLEGFNAAEFEAINFQVLTVFSNTFHSLQPGRLPGFGFAWLELISHRMFMPKLLLAKNQKGWQLIQRLLIDLLKFLEPYLRTAQMNPPVQLLYTGTLRVLLVLLHDFPGFLCDYHFSLCDCIPTSCIQLRNLVLSAYPRNMRLPDPFTPNLKVDLLPEISQSPRVYSNYTQALSYNNLKSDIDTYLKTRQPTSVLMELPQKLLLPPAEQAQHGTPYNVPAINALVFYIGIQAISMMQSKSSPATITHSAPMDIFHYLAHELDSEGRYLFLNAVANQLRYPNNHTHLFSCVLLYLFSEASQEIVKEQITRVLLERLIVNRPHPWGLLITFIELIKNPRYNFWAHPFCRCAPEIEKLFSSVARSCISSAPPAKPVAEGDGVQGLGGGTATSEMMPAQGVDPNPAPTGI